MNVTIDDEGRTQVIDRYVVSSPVTGQALRVVFDVGDKLKKGDVITRIVPLKPVILDARSKAEAEARVEAAEALLQAAREKMQASRAAADYAASELARLEQLYASGLVSEDSRERAETSARQSAAMARSAQFEIDVALFEKEAALTALKYVDNENPGDSTEDVLLTAPVDGVILKVNHRSEGAVREGTPIVDIGDPKAIEVVAELLSADAVRITEGTPVFFHRWGGTTALQGRVRIIEPTGFKKISALGVEEQRVQVISDITSAPETWGRLGDGYRVEASFVIWKEDHVLQVPASSLFRVNDQWALFAVDGGKAELRTVSIGQRNGLIAEVLSGISEGESVITHPDSAIENGTPVRRRE